MKLQLFRRVTCSDISISQFTAAGSLVTLALCSHVPERSRAWRIYTAYCSPHYMKERRIMPRSGDELYRECRTCHVTPSRRSLSDIHLKSTRCRVLRLIALPPPTSGPPHRHFQSSCLANFLILWSVRQRWRMRRPRS